MKAIIEGKRYDTETAEQIHEWDNGWYNNDFRWRLKTLFRTKKGSWFILHKGGPLTDMAVSCGSNSTSGSSSIEIISDDDAFRFLCSHDGEDVAEKYFPKRIQDA